VFEAKGLICLHQFQLWSFTKIQTPENKGKLWSKQVAFRTKSPDNCLLLNLPICLSRPQTISRAKCHSSTNYSHKQMALFVCFGRLPLCWSRFFTGSDSGVVNNEIQLKLQVLRGSLTVWLKAPNHKWSTLVKTYPIGIFHAECSPDISRQQISIDHTSWYTPMKVLGAWVSRSQVTVTCHNLPVLWQYKFIEIWSNLIKWNLSSPKREFL